MLGLWLGLFAAGGVTSLASLSAAFQKWLVVVNALEEGGAYLTEDGAYLAEED